VITFLAIYGAFLAFKPDNFEIGSGGTILVNGQPFSCRSSRSLR
jgi:hypothetical protein